MSNVLSEDKKQQVIALGRLGWPLRRIEKATGVRRETAGAYLKAAGITVHGPGRRSSAKPAIRVATDSEDSKPANDAGVTTDSIRPFSEKPPIQLPAPKLSTSDCVPFRETIELGLSRGAMPWPSGRTWSPTMVSAALTTPSSDSFANSAVRSSPKPSASFSLAPEKKHRSITALVRWFAIRKRASTGGRGCS